jgi:hypothetical protein
LLRDKRVFTDADKLLSEQQLRTFLTYLLDNDQYPSPEMTRIDRFRDFFQHEGNRFASPSLREKLDQLVVALRDLQAWMFPHFFVFPKQAGTRLLSMRPEWNVDREGSGDAREMKAYSKLQDELGEKIRAVTEAYRLYRRAVVETLAE